MVAILLFLKNGYYNQKNYFLLVVVILNVLKAKLKSCHLQLYYLLNDIRAADPILFFTLLTMMIAVVEFNNQVQISKNNNIRKMVAVLNIKCKAQ